MIWGGGGGVQRGGVLAPTGTFGDVWSYFRSSQLEVVLLGPLG